MIESASSSKSGWASAACAAFLAHAVAQAQGEDDRGRDDHRDAEIGDSPGTNEWVRVSTKPSSDGPTNPPRLPTELISPMLPAAAASVRSRLGSAQNAGMYAFSPASATVNSATATISRASNDSEGGDHQRAGQRGGAQVDRHRAVQPALAGAVRAPADQELADQPAQRRDDHGPGQRR